MAAPVGNRALASSRAARVALVGDRSSSVPAHARIAHLLAPPRPGARVPLDVSWVGTPEVAATDLAAFDGIWAIPGSPYLDAAGMFAAIGHARAHGVPLLGTCGGFQH